MSPWINYHHLFYFKTIAEEGSVSKAAEKLRLGQPTLSAQLKQFESSLQVQLFERHHKKLILTEQGRVALNYARNIFDMGSEMYEVLHDRISPSKSTIHIGAMDSIPKQIIMNMVQKVLSSNNCLVTLLEGKADELLLDLVRHKIDICLMNFMPTSVQTKNLVHRVITQRTVSIFGAPQFKGLRKNFPFSVQDQPMILPTYHSKLRYDLDHWSQSNNIKFNVFVESQDISVKTLLAVNGFGLIAASAPSVSPQIKTGELFEIGSLTGVFEELLLVSAQRQIQNPVAKDLMYKFTIDPSDTHWERAPLDAPNRPSRLD